MSFPALSVCSLVLERQHAAAFTAFVMDLAAAAAENSTGGLAGAFS